MTHILKIENNRATLRKIKLPKRDRFGRFMSEKKKFAVSCPICGTTIRFI